MTSRKIIGTLRRVTRTAQKKKEKEEKARKFLAEALERERLRKEKIWTSEDPEAIAGLIVEEILDQAKKMAERGYYTDFLDIRRAMRNHKAKKLALKKLRALGLAAEIICGQGHKWPCDGTFSFEICWPELRISWGADSMGWRRKRKCRD